MAAGYPVETAAAPVPTVVPGTFVGVFQPARIKTMAEVSVLSQDKSACVCESDTCYFSFVFSCAAPHVHAFHPCVPFQLVDARAATRFSGQVEEQRPGLLRGHIPGAVNVWMEECSRAPADSLVSPLPVVRYVLPLDELRALFAARGVTWTTAEGAPRPVVASCGSGQTACVLLFALHLLGAPAESTFLYAGSWAEWGLPANNMPRE